MWLHEDDHGLGINRPITIEQRDALEAAVDAAATQAHMLGVPMENFLTLCEASHECIVPAPDCGDADCMACAESRLN